MWLVLWLAFPVWMEDVGSEPHTSLYWEDFGGFSTFFNHPSVLEAQI
jgi:hypothetical protein